MAQAICRVLIYSLWQGMLLALAAGLVVGCTKQSAPRVRYRWLCGLSLLFLSGLAATLGHELNTRSATGDLTGSAIAGTGWLVDYCDAHAFAIVTIWLAVAALKSLRLAAGWHYMHRIRREVRGASALWVDQVLRLSRQMGVRQVVKVVESGLARVPMVIGQLKPIVVIPLGLINHLPPGEMEAVLLHELAHVRRCDHVVNLVQRVAECLLFFNPGALWVSALIRDERENCCDDLAIAQTGDKVELVRALIRFKEHSLGSLAMAFPGNRRQLLHRVMRLSRDRNKALDPGERVFLAGGLLGLLWLLSMSPGGPVRIADKASAAASMVRPPSQELALLESRQRVTENMEWVEAQLSSLRHEKAARHTGGIKPAGTAGGVATKEAKERS